MLVEKVFRWQTPGIRGWGGDLNESCFCLSSGEYWPTFPSVFHSVRFTPTNIMCKNGKNKNTNQQVGLTTTCIKQMNSLWSGLIYGWCNVFKSKGHRSQAASGVMTHVSCPWSELFLSHMINALFNSADTQTLPPFTLTLSYSDNQTLIKLHVTPFCKWWPFWFWVQWRNIHVTLLKRSIHGRGSHCKPFGLWPPQQYQQPTVWVQFHILRD